MGGSANSTDPDRGGLEGAIVAEFGPFVLDERTFELRCDDEVVSVEPKVFDVLLHLVRNRDRVVPKTELLDTVWGDRFVSESALSTRIKQIRRMLGDDGHTQRFVQTSHGRGYRFVADATIVAGGPDPSTPGVDAVNDSVREVRHNIPAERTRLIGRDADVERVAAVCRHHRMVTVLGIGGIGKTRVAMAVGRTLSDELADGVWFVDLVPATDLDAVVDAVGAATGVTLPPADALDDLARVLATRQMLIVLDNCEHVAEAAAVVADRVLDRAPGVQVLATSRVPLGLGDEWRVPLDPLPGSDGLDDGPAEELFVATAARFGASIRPADRDGVRRLCARLDGLPLAIELAAAQVRAMTVGDVLARLDGQFDLLRAPSDQRSARHADLTTVLRTSWELSNPAERSLLDLLAVFPGTVRLDDVERVAGDDGAVDRLFRLVDRSLVVPAGDAPTRYRLLETVRAFVRAHGDADAADARFVEWALTTVGDDPVRQVYDLRLAQWCSDHYDDLRVAERILLADRRHREASVVAAACGLAMHLDDGTRAAALLRRIGVLLPDVDDASLRCRLHVAASLAAVAARSPSAIVEHGVAARREAERADDESLLGIALTFTSWAQITRDPSAALALLDAAAARAEHAGVRPALDNANAYRAFALAMDWRFDEALDQALAVVDRSDLSGESQPVVAAVVAVVALLGCSEPDRAIPYLDLLLDRTSRELRMWGNETIAAATLASRGDVVGALELVGGVERRLTAAGREHLPDTLLPAVALAVGEGEAERAARWLRAIRTAGRPTQSLQVSVMYRRLRERVGRVADVDADDRPIDAVAAEATEWMRALASRLVTVDDAIDHAVGRDA